MWCFFTRLYVFDNTCKVHKYLIEHTQGHFDLLIVF